MAVTATQQREFIKVGIGLYGAALGSTYLNLFAQVSEAGFSIGQIYTALMADPFSQQANLYPLYLTNEQFAARLVSNATGNTLTGDAKAQAEALVLGKLNAAPAGQAITVTRGEAAMYFVNLLDAATESDAVFGSSAKLFDNRVTVAQYYSVDKGLSASSLSNLQNVVSGVTSTTNVTGTAALDAALGGNNTSTGGQTITLTTGVNNVTGSAGDDTIDGSRLISGGTAADTYNNADSVDGGAGTDTLFAQLTANVFANSIKNIEVLSIEAQAAVTVDLNTGDAALTTVKSVNSGANLLTVQNIQSAPTSYVVTNSSGGFTATVSTTKLAGTTDAATLDLSNVTAGTVTLQTAAAGSGYETLTINSNGSVANVLTALTDGNGTSLATVNVAGAQDLTLPLSDTTVTTLNAAAFTGKLTATVAAGNTQNMTITGGTANDVINMNGTYTSSDVINGGAGTDRLTLTNAEAVAATTAQAGVTNVEVIGLSDGLNGAVSVNNFGATSLRFGADMAGAGTVNYAAGTGGLDLQNRAGNTSLTANIAGTATTDVLNVTVGSSAAGNTFGAVGVTINGAETVNITSQGGANTFGAGFSLTDTAANQAIVITGSQSLTFTGAVRADSINASGMTGTATLTLTGGTGTTATTITGTANGDTLNGSTLGDIIDGGAGADTIANVITGTSASAADVITGGAGFDTFILRGDTATGALATILNTTSLITDFTVGSSATTTDILSLSSTNTNYGNAGTGFHAGIAAATAVAAGSTVIQTVAQNAAAAALVTGTDLIKLTTGVATTGLTLQAAFNAAIGTGTVTGLGAGTEAFVSMYDSTNGRMLILVADANSGTNTVLETGDLVSLVGSITMSATDYANFSAANLALITA